MSEFVTEMQERMLPEYEKMKHHQLLSDEAIKQCICKREDFLYKITQPNKSPEYYLEYIIYERKMYKLIEDKEIELDTKLYSLKASISARIIRLYRAVLQRFPHEVHLWENFLKFSKKSNPTEVAGIYEKMISFHADKPNVWAEAALWTYETTQDMKRTKAIFLRGLNRLPSSERILMSFMQVMLNEALKMSDKRVLNNNTESEQDIGLSSAVTLYTSTRKQIQDPGLFLKLLAKCEQPKLVNLTASLQYMIIKDLKHSAPRHENLWDALAQRELNGLSLVDIMEFLDEKENDDKDNKTIKPFAWKSYTLEKRIKQCCRVYESAVSALHTPKMWNLYINAMLHLNKDMVEEAYLKRKCLAKAFKTGHESHKMSVEHYLAYCDLMHKAIEGPSVAEKIIREAIQYEKNPQLYERLMEMYIAKDDLESIEDLLQNATTHLRNQSSSLWLRIISYYTKEMPHETNKILDLYREGCKQNYDEFIQLRCNYLEYCEKINGIKRARKLYEELINIPPYKKELHNKMIALDMSRKNPKPSDIKHCRECFERLTYLFGKTEPSVWMDFIKFERENGNPSTISNLYERAKAALSSEYVENFVTSYALEKCNEGMDEHMEDSIYI